ncbi:MAG: transposase [Actinomycetota bacterium]|nr:transposase [Actinomycetota bacterium]
MAEATYQGRRLVVHPTRLIGKQAELWPSWRYFAFLTDMGGTAIEVDQFQRNRAAAELVTCDIGDSALEHLPSGDFAANGAWFWIAMLAHNLARWSARLGEMAAAGTFVAAAAMRARFISIPARLVIASRRITLWGPRHWPWADEFLHAPRTLRTLQPVTG